MTFSPYLIILTAILISYLYVVMSEYFTHRKCNYIHETAVAILLGVILGVFITLFTDIFDNDQYGRILRNIIILLLLPPMLFEDGYNIRKRKFFQNIFYINLYGIVGTIINFFIMVGIIYTFNEYGLIKSINNEQIHLKTWQILAMASCLCSIDTVVSQKIVNPQRYPKLFSIIFGESIMKDTIAVTLFDSIINVYHTLSKDHEFNASAIGFLALKFLEVAVCSLLIGILCALFTTLLFKNMRFLIAEKGVAEVALILMTGYASYIFSEWGQFSGVISMLFCGITLSHFNVYNLTNQGKSAAKITVSTIALIVQGLLFFLLGAFIFSCQFNKQEDKSVQYTFSYTLLLITMLAIVVGRLVNIYLMSLLGYLFIGESKWRVNSIEYQIIFMSGLVKGAVPFAIVLTMPLSKGVELFSTACIQNTVIVIVFLTSLVFNSVMPKLLRNRLKKIDEMIRWNVSHPSLYDSLLLDFHRMHDHNLVDDHQSFHKEEHNEEQEKSGVEMKFVSHAEMEKMALYTKFKSTTQKYWRRCEEGMLKPLLIYDYHNRKQQIKQQKISLRKAEALEYWKRYRDTLQEGEDEESNFLLDVKLIEHDVYSQQQAEDAELEEFISKSRSQTGVEQEITNIKIQKSLSEPVNLDSHTGLNKVDSGK